MYDSDEVAVDLKLIDINKKERNWEIYDTNGLNGDGLKYAISWL